MNANELQRIENDLATIQQVVKRDKPYSKGDIWPLLALGIGSIVSLFLLTFKVLPPRASVLLTLVPGIMLYARRYFDVHKTQAERPVLWKEYRWSAALAAILLPAAFGWLWWSQRFGASDGMSAAAVVFCMGIGMSFIGVMDSARRYYLITSIPLMILALSLPAIGSQGLNIAYAGTAFLAITCFTNAVFIWYSTRATPGNGQNLCEPEGPIA